MKKIFATLMVIAVCCCTIINTTAISYAENKNESVRYHLILRRILQEGQVPVTVPEPELRKTIQPNWQNGQTYFKDTDGFLVHTSIPNAQTIVPYAGRALIMEEYVPLPDNGNYYERLYGQTTLSAYHFNNYETNIWAKASQYVVQKSTTVSWTHSGQLDITYKKKAIAHFGLSYTKSTADSIGIYISADPAKYSKLALLVRYTLCSVQFQTYGERNGEVFMNDWEFGQTKNPYDYRYEVVYQEE